MASAAQIDHSGSGTDDRANDQAAGQIGGDVRSTRCCTGDAA
jgi:hypothetical protein